MITKNVTPANDLHFLMAFKPLSFVHDGMRFAGPIATLGLTLPQLQDLSMNNIQRVGETSLAAMLFVAIVQGALVSLKEACTKTKTCYHQIVGSLPSPIACSDHASICN